MQGMQRDIVMLLEMINDCIPERLSLCLSLHSWRSNDERMQFLNKKTFYDQRRWWHHLLTRISLILNSFLTKQSLIHALVSFSGLCYSWKNMTDHTWWLEQNPDIVLVHYLNVPFTDDNKGNSHVVCPTGNILADSKKEWTRQDLFDELKPMCK